MKKIITTAVLAASLFMGGVAFAQSQQVALPSAGLTPESPFYFLDKLGETLQRFFTFNPESRGRLEITFAKERIAEIKLILDDKGVTAKGLNVAEAGLQDNISRATVILAQEKQAGKDTRNIAKELSDEISPANDALKDTFKSEKNALETKEDELKAKIKEARRAGDATLVESLTKQLNELKAQKELLEQKEDEQKQDLDEQEEALEEQMDAKDEAEKKIREAEKERAEIINEAKEEGLDVPAEAFAQFDSLIVQAKSALDSGKYDEAKQLAKQAGKSLEGVDENIENLKDAKENEQELKEEAEDQQRETEEKLKEADKENAEKIKEELKQKEEKLKEDQGKAEEEVRRAEEQLQKPESKSEEQPESKSKEQKKESEEQR